jgi:hypothetical protein
MKRTKVVGWGKRAAARNGHPWFRLLPGSPEAIAEGCVCRLLQIESDGRALVELNDECKVPQYDSYSHYAKKSIPGTRVYRQQRSWSYHWIPEDRP